jgi:hypothetical protein
MHRDSRLRLRAACLALAVALAPPAASAAARRSLAGGRNNAIPAAPSTPGDLCAAAVHTAELRYHLPPGLLPAIGQVESGRPDPVTHRTQPWPWTIQAENRSLYFDSKTEAVQWVLAAQARGVTSIDTGCMQVNLFFHPQAFQSVDEAFDPAHNADYAARFLIALHASTGDWQQAAGLYHSQTLALAIPYRERVERVLNGGPLPPPPPPTPLSLLRVAWGATIPTPKPDLVQPGMGDWSVLLHPAHRPAALRPQRHKRAEMLTYAR